MYFWGASLYNIFDFDLLNINLNIFSDELYKNQRIVGNHVLSDNDFFWISSVARVRKGIKGGEGIKDVTDIGFTEKLHLFIRINLCLENIC